MMYEMRRKLEPTFLLIQGIFNLPHHIGMVWEELAFDDTVTSVSYAQWGNGIAEQLNVIAVTRFSPWFSSWEIVAWYTQMAMCDVNQLLCPLSYGPLI